MERNDRPGLISLDKEILSELEPYLDCSLPFSGNYQILNHHLAVGARVAGAIAERNGDAGLPPGSVRLRFRGTAGQSFGAFLCRGVHLELEGEANDYVGKGLSGGEITIRPFRQVSYAHASHQHLIIGNTVLYGATGGKLFAAGQAGDRFAVRNSGAVAVIEGAGNHCCEYMTGGIVVVLGRAGRNFGAGMSNGLAYVLDEAGTFASRLNGDMVELSELDAEDVDLLRKLIHEHEEKTVSTRARNLLVRWEEYRAAVQEGGAQGCGRAGRSDPGQIPGIGADGAGAEPGAPDRIDADPSSITSTPGTMLPGVVFSFARGRAPGPHGPGGPQAHMNEASPPHGGGRESHQPDPRRWRNPQGSPLVFRLQCSPIPVLGQQPLGEVDPFVQLRHLICLVNQAVLDVFQRRGVVSQLLTELGERGSRRSPPAYGSANGSRHQHESGARDGQGDQEHGFAHVISLQIAQCYGSSHRPRTFSPRASCAPGARVQRSLGESSAVSPILILPARS